MLNTTYSGELLLAYDDKICYTSNVIMKYLPLIFIILFVVICVVIIMIAYIIVRTIVISLLIKFQFMHLSTDAGDKFINVAL